MVDYLKAPIGGIPVGVYALIGLTTGILAYTTLAEEKSGSSSAESTAAVLPTMNLFSEKDGDAGDTGDTGDADKTPTQSGGKRKHKKHRKTPHKKHRGGSSTKKNK